jgi:hypothetical protein
MSASTLSASGCVRASSLARSTVAVLVRHFVSVDLGAARCATAVGNLDTMATAEAGLALRTHSRWRYHRLTGVVLLARPRAGTTAGW